MGKDEQGLQEIRFLKIVNVKKKGEECKNVTL